MKMMVSAFDVRLDHSPVAHRTDQLSCNDRIAHADESTMRVQKFMRQAIGVSDCNSARSALTSICYNSIHRRTQRGMLQIDTPLAI
jgi:hypothetical protein